MTIIDLVIRRGTFDRVLHMSDSQTFLSWERMEGRSGPLVLQVVVTAGESSHLLLRRRKRVENSRKGLLSFLLSVLYPVMRRVLVPE